MLHRGIFEMLRAAMAILALFANSSDKFCLNFLTEILSTSLHIMHFVRTFSVTRA